jgi:SAM-dependent methyltransferase
VDRLKRIVKKTPLVRDLARLAMRQVAARNAAAFDSGDYWETRYREGRTSGAGSYNRLAEFKADVLNGFVEEHAIKSVIEFGSGDGSQLRLARYPQYIGVDVSMTAIELTRRLYAGDATKRFVHADEFRSGDKAELSMSLDVIYHLVEDRVFERYMSQLFDAATRYVIIYSSNSDRPSNAVHVRHRKFTDWIERERPDFRQCGFVANRYPEDSRDMDNTSFADFYFFEQLGQSDVGR